MEPADYRPQRLAQHFHNVWFDARNGILMLTGSFAGAESLADLRAGLETAMYAELPELTVDMRHVSHLPARALREIEVALCLADQMGRKFRVRTAPDSAAELVLRLADVPFAPARHERDRVEEAGP